MPRRTDGLKGSIFARGRSWVVKFPLANDPATGRRRYTWETFPTEDLALDRLAELNHKRRRGERIDPERQTVDEYIEEWLEIRSAKVRPNSLRRYHYDLKPVLDYLGDLPLRSLDVLTIERWHAWMARTVSTNAAQRAHDKLSSALGAAVRAERIPRNPCRLVDPPKHRSQRGRAMDQDEVRRFRAQAHDPEYVRQLRSGSPFFWDMLLATGLRIGELQALSWRAVDLERGWLTVEAGRTKDIDGREIIGAPKTNASYRRVPIGQDVIAGLRRQRAEVNQMRLRMGQHWRDNDLVFPANDGAMIPYITLYQQFRRILQLAGIDDVTPHGLRHTMATMSLENGVHFQTVKELLGHASATMTLDLYGHVTDASKQEAARLLGDLLRDADEDAG